MTKYRTVLFDLDGTLADTAPDLIYALNVVLEEQGRAPLPDETLRPAVSHGTAALIQCGFGIGPETPGFEPLKERLIELYRTHLTRGTRLFAGMAETLDELERRGLGWGVVTNKPAFLTDPLMEQLGLARRACCIVSGDTAARPKPHPEPMLHACRAGRTDPARCLYVGDAERDVQAGRSVGMTTLVALFGYIGPDDRPEEWGADGFIRAPEELLGWL